MHLPTPPGVLQNFWGNKQRYQPTFPPRRPVPPITHPFPPHRPRNFSISFIYNDFKKLSPPLSKRTYSPPCNSRNKTGPLKASFIRSTKQPQLNQASSGAPHQKTSMLLKEKQLDQQKDQTAEEDENSDPVDPVHIFHPL
jgi:hypothetical protein